MNRMKSTKSTQLEILRILKENEASFVSGEGLAERLGISRPGVWKHINRLKEMGYEIQSQSRMGYRLVAVPDSLAHKEIVPNLKTRWLGSFVSLSQDRRFHKRSCFAPGSRGRAPWDPCRRRGTDKRPRPPQAGMDILSEPWNLSLHPAQKSPAGPHCAAVNLYRLSCPCEDAARRVRHHRLDQVAKRRIDKWQESGRNPDRNAIGPGLLTIHRNGNRNQRESQQGGNGGTFSIPGNFDSHGSRICRKKTESASAVFWTNSSGTTIVSSKKGSRP